jgi:hypothetical protein
MFSLLAATAATHTPTRSRHNATKMLSAYLHPAALTTTLLLASQKCKANSDG